MTKIEWVRNADGTQGRTWNPVRGCTRVSRGCGGPGPHGGCYAEAIAARFSGPGLPYEGIAEMRDGKPRWTGKLVFSESALLDPLKRRKPTVYFVNSMSDLFHENMPEEWIDKVFAVMALCPQHTFQVLTKRPARMRAYCATLGRHHETDRVSLAAKAIHAQHGFGERGFSWTMGDGWHLPNVWLGTSVEDQPTADARIPDLLATPAAVRFVSAEPLLGSIDFTNIAKANGYGSNVLEGYRHDFGVPMADLPGKIDQVIVGGESGPHARPCWTPGVRSIVRQCAHAGTAAFVKQLGADVRDRNDAGFEGIDEDEWPDIDPSRIESDLDGTRDGYQGAPVRIRLHDRKGGDPSEWPAALRVRQMPTIQSAPARAREPADA